MGKMRVWCLIYEKIDAVKVFMSRLSAWKGLICPEAGECDVARRGLSRCACTLRISAAWRYCTSNNRYMSRLNDEDQSRAAAATALHHDIVSDGRYDGPYRQVVSDAAAEPLGQSLAPAVRRYRYQ